MFGRKVDPASVGTTLKSPQSPPRISGARESVETFVLVFTAFLVLGVEAEGFVIPTGSMAPTLLGRHKDVVCPQCGLAFDVDANREVEADGGGPTAVRVEGAVCVNCRFPSRVADQPNFQGDRVYVLKTPLSLPFFPSLTADRLNRWEIAVFKLPEDPEVRYIKRTVGMPGDTLRISRGDIWVRPEGDVGPFHRALRPLPHQDAMQILVNDDALRPRSLADDPRWLRWTSNPPEAWSESTTETGRYQSKADAEDWSELRYNHVVPDPAQWQAIAQGLPLPKPPRPTLVTDFYSYDTDITSDARTNSFSAVKPWRQADWVGDLQLAFRVQIAEARGRLRVELVKAGVPFRAEVDLASGLASLSRAGEILVKPAPTTLNRPGAHTIVFTNVDDRLNFRVDGSTPFGSGVPYDPADAFVPDASDLAPAAVAAVGPSIVLEALRLTRDIYYTQQPGRPDVFDLEEPCPAEPVAMFDWLADPSRFAAFAGLGHKDFPIRAGHYMMLGDNSPYSRDGRDWETTDQIDPDRPGRGWDHSGRKSWEVPSNLVIGKGFVVHWPHARPFGPTFRLSRDTVLPLRPAFEKMRWIR